VPPLAPRVRESPITPLDPAVFTPPDGQRFFPDRRNHHAVSPSDLRRLSPEAYDARRAIVLVLHQQGYNGVEIGRMVGLCARSVRYVLRAARDQGTLRSGLEEVLRDVDNEALPLALEGLMRHLRAGHWDAIERTLAGRGVFVHHQQVKGAQDSGPRTLTINVLNAPAAPPMTLTGKVVGNPRQDVCLPGAAE
jgi:hypothetical protein